MSGDTSCADHNIAWKVRHGLKLDHVPAGVNKTSPAPHGDDQIIYDLTGASSASGFGHPDCGLGEKAIRDTLAKTHPVRPQP